MAMLMLGLRAADTLLVRTETESQMRETQRVMHMQVSPPQSTDVATFTDAPTPSAGSPVAAHFGRYTVISRYKTVTKPLHDRYTTVASR